jgi:hypothetical protein
MVLITAGLISLFFLTEATPVTYIIASLIVVGAGFGLFTSPNTNAVMSSVEKRFYGVAAGTVSTMRLLGQMLSMGIAMTIFAVIIGRVQITPEYYPRFMTSIHIGFAIFSVLCIIGIFASLVRGNVRR